MLRAMVLDVQVLLPLATKMAVTALAVVAATLTAERAGAVLGAMIATLPTASGPAYAFLALDHDVDFIAAAGLLSAAVNIANGVFVVTYVRLAQAHGTLPSLGGALVAWLAAAVVVRSVAWTAVGAVAATVPVLLLCIVAAAPYRHARIPPARPRWYDIPVRAGMVGAMVGLVISVSTLVGPAVTGLLAAFPIVLSSVVLILQPRIGGPAAAAVMANVPTGLIGFAGACLTVHLAVGPLGAWPGLAAALAVAIVFNAAVLLLRRRPRPR